MTQERGYHQGELAVQRQAGVRREADELVGMLAPPVPSPGRAKFLAERAFAVITARDDAGRLWTTPLFGGPGFLEQDGEKLRVHVLPAGPLQHLPADQPVGMITIDLATRRRLRVNGQVLETGPDGFTVLVEASFGNCPQYIQGREVLADVSSGSAGGTSPADAAQVARLVAAADTFFLGTVHPTRGADASHKGGQPGFLRADADGLWWPDYRGNNMFNSLGNITVDPSTALFVPDFAGGRALYLSGTAQLEWYEPFEPGVMMDEGMTGRRVRFHPEQALIGPMPLQATEPDPSPALPRIR
ncbi:MAG TPA: pyridoxamine 5'-phosphate oxidase family protein [Sporichthyaceae bacterium]|nr:pyridoxamine 5'-phosphate oxidase family protein [Sporichthyaceae bacterium]